MCRVLARELVSRAVLHATEAAGGGGGEGEGQGRPVALTTDLLLRLARRAAYDGGAGHYL